ncbi:MAG: hypothetical protein AB4041_03105 [Microcystaceae cyanobacterium]
MKPNKTLILIDVWFRTSTQPTFTIFLRKSEKVSQKILDNCREGGHKSPPYESIKRR